MFYIESIESGAPGALVSLRQREETLSMRESKIENRLTQLAKLHGFIAYKWIGTRRGVPDRLVIYKGKVHLVELKSTEGSLTPQQIHVHDLIMKQLVRVETLSSIVEVDQFVERMLSNEI